MTTIGFANIVIGSSLLVSLIAYIVLSRHEGSYINILIPSLIIAVPAYYLLPLFYASVFGADASPYAYSYVYATLAVENVAFVYAYVRSRGKMIRLPFRWSNHNFTLLSLTCLGVAFLLYLPILLQFPEYLLDPREIYTHTRTGFGTMFYTSSTLAYLAIILILCAKRSARTKTIVVMAAVGILLLHGSKGQVLNAVLILALYHVYVKGQKVGVKGAAITCAAMALILFLLFAATMSLGESPQEVGEAVSQYSDYTRNAMLVIDTHFPLQYGRLALEANFYGLIPRVLMPSKPKNFGPMRLDDEFYPEMLDADAGAPSFGVGVQYADFGNLAIVYIALFAMLRGWLARVFVNRLKLSHHPADFFMLAFLADVTLFPVGVGWFLPEALLVALLLRLLSTIGANTSYSDRRLATPKPAYPHRSGSITQPQSV